MTTNKKFVWAVVSLIGLYVAAQLIADIGATKMVEIGGVVFPGGTIIFALTFTVRDLIHKRLGKEWAKAAIWIAAAANVLLSLYLMWIATMKAPVWYAQAGAWSDIFMLVPAITIASIVAELLSQLVDTEVFAAWRRIINDRYEWSWVLVSNAFGIPVDSFLFAMLAFVVLPPVFGGMTRTVGEAMAAAGGQMLFKIVLAVISMPTIYLVKKRTDEEGITA